MISYRNLTRVQTPVEVIGGRWLGRRGWIYGTENTRPYSNGGAVILVRLAPTGRAGARDIRVRIGSLRELPEIERAST